MIACDVVWAEVATAYQPGQAVLEDLAAFGLRFEPIIEASALKAAEAWDGYRAAGEGASRPTS